MHERYDYSESIDESEDVVYEINDREYRDIIFIGDVESDIVQLVDHLNSSHGGYAYDETRAGVYTIVDPDGQRIIEVGTKERAQDLVQCLNS